MASGVKKTSRLIPVFCTIILHLLQSGGLDDVEAITKDTDGIDDEKISFDPSGVSPGLYTIKATALHSILGHKFKSIQLQVGPIPVSKVSDYQVLLTLVALYLKRMGSRWEGRWSRRD